jgi:hypothetical protein
MNTLKVNFFVDADRINSEGLAPIRVRSKHASTKLIIRQTGFFIEPNQWVNGKPKNYIIEKKLDDLKNQIKKTYHNLTEEGDAVSLADVWETLFPENEKTKKVSSQKIVDWIDYYRNNSPYSYDYLRGAEDIRIQLTGKNKKGKVFGKGYNPGLKFSDLNQTVIDALSIHMVRDNRLTTGQVVKVIKHLRQMAKMATNLKMEVGSITFKAPKNFNKKTKNQIRLTFNELMKIKNTDLSDNDEKNVRDMFLFLAFTGLRHSDFIRITLQDDEGDFLDLKQNKTSEAVVVTINKYSRAILDKYSKGKSKVDLVFPVYTQFAFNTLVHVVARKAGLNELVNVTKHYGTKQETEQRKKYQEIASHTGRRSCSRILAVLGVAEDIIAEELGQSNGSITRHYIGNSDHMERVRVVQDAWNRAESFFNPEGIMRNISNG